MTLCGWGGLSSCVVRVDIQRVWTVINCGWSGYSPCVGWVGLDKGGQSSCLVGVDIHHDIFFARINSTNGFQIRLYEDHGQNKLSNLDIYGNHG